MVLQLHCFGTSNCKRRAKERCSWSNRDLKRGIDKAVNAITSDLEKQAQKVGDASEKIQQVTTISSNNDSTIGELIATALER